MNKLTKVTYRQFQRHRELILEVDPLVTVLVGDTDSGKSSAIRGLSFALLNTPSTAKLIRRKQSKPAEVEAVFDLVVVKRVRGKKQNDYFLDGNVFKAFGRDKNPVPPDIAAFLNVGDVNFQRQIDGPSWFTESGGSVSKRLNTIVDLQVVDAALAESQSLTRSAANAVKFCRERLTKAKAAARELEWVPAVVGRFNELQALEADAAAIAQKRAALASLIGAATSCRKTRDRALESLTGAKKWLSAGVRHRKSAKTAKILGTLVRQLERIEKVKRNAVPDVSAMTALRAKCDAVAERRRTLELIVDELRTARRERCKIEARLVEAKENERKLRPAVCPACKQRIVRKPAR